MDIDDKALYVGRDLRASCQSVEDQTAKCYKEYLINVDQLQTLVEHIATHIPQDKSAPLLEMLLALPEIEDCITK